MFAFTREQLRAFAPMARADIVDALVTGADEIAAAKIDTPLRFQHFMAEIAVESGGLRLLEENLTYSAERLHAVWPNRFPSVADARPYERNPKKLAEKVYGGRMGNTKPGDAYVYRGSGLLETTGKSNFEAAGYADNPEVLRTPSGALTSALKFWTDNNCNQLADADDLPALRKRVNGGTNGLAEARNYLTKAKRCFVGAPDLASTALDAAPASDSAPAELSKDQIKALQQQLIKLGYSQLGEADGYIGSMTIGAISSFQAENGLEVNGRFDAETQAHLPYASPREIVRSSVTPVGSRIMAQAATLKKGALAVMGTAGISASADPLTQIEAAKAYLERAKNALSPFTALTDFVAQHWLMAVAAAGVGVFLVGRNIERARIDDHLSGASA